MGSGGVAGGDVNGRGGQRAIYAGGVASGEAMAGLAAGRVGDDTVHAGGTALITLPPLLTAATSGR